MVDPSVPITDMNSSAEAKTVSNMSKMLVVLLHARLMPIKYTSCSGTATPRLVPGLYRDTAVLGKGERQPGRVAQPLQDRLGDVAQAGPGLDAGRHRYRELGRPLCPSCHTYDTGELYLTYHARAGWIIHIFR